MVIALIQTVLGNIHLWVETLLGYAHEIPIIFSVLGPQSLVWPLIPYSVRGTFPRVENGGMAFVDHRDRH